MNMSEIRQQYPQYAGLSDEELAGAFYKKFYADKISWGEFLKRINLGATQEAEATGAAKSALISAGRTFDKIGAGARDLYALAIGDEEARRNIAAKQSEKSRMFGPLEARHPVATMVGGAAPYAAIPGVGQGAGLAARVAGEAVIGGGLGALEYGGSPVEGAGYGAAGGVLGHLAGAGLQRLGGGAPPSPVTPEHRAMTQQAEQLGYGLTPAQRTGSARLDKLEAGMTRTPLLSAPFDRLARANQSEVNRVAREAIGETPVGQLTDNVLEEAHARIGRQYDELTPEGHVLNLRDDETFLMDLHRLDDEFSRSPMRSDQWTPLSKNIVEMVKTPLTPKEYHRHTSEIARKARQVGRGDNADPALERALYGVREAMDGAFERSLGPKVLDKLQKTRSQYRALKVIERPGVIKGGDVKVMPLRTVLKREGKGRVRGDSDLAAMAKLGEHFAPRVPTSGTAEGMAVQSMIADPIKSTAIGLGGNALASGYMRGGGPLSHGADLGQAAARAVAGGARGYGSPAQIGRIAGLVAADDDSPPVKPYSPLAEYGDNLPEAAVSTLAGKPWFRSWITSRVKPRNNSANAHAQHLRMNAAGKKMTQDERDALEEIYNALARSNQ